MTRVGLLPIAVLFLTGCTTIPTGPGVMVLPGTGKDFEQFKYEDAVCRNWALEQTGTTPNQASTDSAVGGAAIGTVLGAASGAAIGAASGNPAAGAAVGAGAGLVGGTLVGSSYAAGAYSSVQYRYDVAYMQCMYAKGNQIPVRGQVERPTTQAREVYPPPPSDIPPPPPGDPPPPPPGV